MIKESIKKKNSLAEIRTHGKRVWGGRLSEDVTIILVKDDPRWANRSSSCRGLYRHSKPPKT